MTLNTFLREVIYHLCNRTLRHQSTYTKLELPTQFYPFQRNDWGRKNYQVVSFDERPHRHLVTPRGGKLIRPTSTYIIYGSLNPHERSSGISIGSAVFCVHYSKFSQSFSLGQATPKIGPSHLGIFSPLMHCSLGSPDSALETASRSVQPFLQRSRT